MCVAVSRDSYSFCRSDPKTISLFMDWRTLTAEMIFLFANRRSLSWMESPYFFLFSCYSLFVNVFLPLRFSIRTCELWTIQSILFNMNNASVITHLLKAHILRLVKSISVGFMIVSHTRYLTIFIHSLFGPAKNTTTWWLVSNRKIAILLLFSQQITWVMDAGFKRLRKKCVFIR